MLRLALLGIKKLDQCVEIWDYNMVLEWFYKSSQRFFKWPSRWIHFVLCSQKCEPPEEEIGAFVFCKWLIHRRNDVLLTSRYPDFSYLPRSILWVPFAFVRSRLLPSLIPLTHLAWQAPGIDGYLHTETLCVGISEESYGKAVLFSSSFPGNWGSIFTPALFLVFYLT